MWIRLVGQSLGKCSEKRIIEGFTAMAEDLERSGGVMLSSLVTV